MWFSYMGMTEILMGWEPLSLHADVLTIAFMNSFPFQEPGVREIHPKVEHLYLIMCLLEIIVGLSQNSREPPSFFFMNYREAYLGVTWSGKVFFEFLGRSVAIQKVSLCISSKLRTLAC